VDGRGVVDGRPDQVGGARHRPTLTGEHLAEQASHTAGVVPKRGDEE